MDIERLAGTTLGNYDIGEQEGLHFFSMEYVDGLPLDELVRTKGRLEADEAVSIISQAVRVDRSAPARPPAPAKRGPSRRGLSRRGRLVIAAVLIAVLAFQIAAILAVFAILSSFDYDSLKTTISQAVEEDPCPAAMEAARRGTPVLFTEENRK